MMIAVTAFTACGQKNQQENAQIGSQDVNVSQDIEGDEANNKNGDGAY